ncbi:hypothetical protein UCRPA7_4273 [Phaeoacremonium minimum UCRPA7]|uniref:Uncharacterized protein n=1 Tax=Phaeoacremonium minimum (strain UCR-PA7) TaxID=1286976 RepID=R8BLL7_PHAM7|nr:hypothetical protein UCRPA7_4273 [Phaeoacremonium minimum UCRPA7]EOO00258.1 hypothetical protein UCRPA7_4273 [Phaeoacremonium minimum UCRPA7]
MSPARGNNYEDDGYRLRLAVHEMSQNLGVDVVRGTCHPCAERWAVLFIAADGNTLSTNMTYDPDDDPEEENSSSLTDTDEDDEAEDSRPDLNKDYHQLRDSILKLVEDFEIPQSLEADKGKQTFSNRASGLKKYRSKNKVITTEKSMASRNPYRQKVEAEQRTKAPTGEASTPSSPSESKEAVDTAEEKTELSPVLVTMLTAASSQSRAQSDFVSAHLYWRTLQQLNTLSSASLRANGFSTLLHIFSRGPRDSIHRSASAIEEYDAWLVWLKQSQERADGLIESMLHRLRALRDKMWYVTDVCNSAPYEHSRNIAVALKAMGTPRKTDKYQRTRGRGERLPASNFVYRSESQIVDLLAASEDHGGPNKLSDDQAEKTSRFLTQYGIENFCKGEERIHRFCCEVEACIGKLVGETMMDGPVLWSSELYLRDKAQFDGSNGRRDRDSAAFPDDASSIMSDPERRFTPSNNKRDKPDCESVIQQRLSEDKTRFLDELRRTLTSLLLSDLGNIVFSRGSETDTWFGELGQDCIDRRVAAERKARQALRAEKRRSTRRDLKQRVIEKKKSFGDLRGAGNGPEPSTTDRASPDGQNLEVPSANKTKSIMSASPAATNTDAIVMVLQTLFRDPRIRPKTLFRDLQFIASLVPSTVLDTERGKAFWDCGQAALVLKKEAGDAAAASNSKYRFGVKRWELFCLRFLHDRYPGNIVNIRASSGEPPYPTATDHRVYSG